MAVSDQFSNAIVQNTYGQPPAVSLTAVSATGCCP